MGEEIYQEILSSDFVPLITLLRNAALNSLKYKSELAMVRSQNLDITKFETQLDEFK